MPSWKIDKKKQFVNPYQFVPVDFEETPNRESSSNEELVTGYIDCTLYPVGDIFIPNTSNDKVFGGKTTIDGGYHQEYDFYSYDDLSDKVNPEPPLQPIIPASSIRGVIRSMYESLTNSCLSVLSDKPLSSRGIPYRHKEVQKQPGLIKKENGEYVLYQAERYALRIENYDNDSVNTNNQRYTIQSHCNQQNSCIKKLKVDDKNSRETKYYENGEVVSFKSKNKNNRIVSIADKNYFQDEGYIYLGEMISGKKHESVFKPLKKEDKAKPELVAESLNKYKVALTDYYRNEGINKSLQPLNKTEELMAVDQDNQAIHYGYADLNPEKFNWHDDSKAYPIWYEIIGDKLYFSPAMFGRNMYFNTERKLFGEYQPCTDSSCLCPACKIFGFVSETGSDQAKSSHLSFTDAKLKSESKAEFREKVTLKELSGPKTSSLEFYTHPTGDWDMNWRQDNLNFESYIWNYDWLTSYSTENDKDETKKPENQLFSIDQNSIEPRGRKYYWHDLNALKYRDNNQTIRNISVRPLSGCCVDIDGQQNATVVNVEKLNAKESPIVNVIINQFEFKVYFEDITKDELSALALSLGLGSKKPRYSHKMGHGKPLGLGSTKIVVDDVKIRKFSIEEDSNQTSTINYKIESVLKSDDYPNLENFSNHIFYNYPESASYAEQEKHYDKIEQNQLIVKNNRTLRAILRLTDVFELKGETIRYPIGQNKYTTSEMVNSSANWFVGNRNSDVTSTTQRYNYLLPNVLRKDQNLPAFHFQREGIDLKNISEPKTIYKDVVSQEESVAGLTDTKAIYKKQDPVTDSKTKAKLKKKPDKKTGVIVRMGRSEITIRVGNKEQNYGIVNADIKVLEKLFGRNKINNQKIQFNLKPDPWRPDFFLLTDIGSA